MTSYLNIRDREWDPRDLVSLDAWRRPHWSLLTKTLAMLITLTFLLPYVAFAFEPGTYPVDLVSEFGYKPLKANGRTLTIKPEWGRVTSSYHGTSGRTIVYIQDLHCNYEVQSNIQAMLNNFMNRNQLKLVGVEGESTPVNVSKLSTIPLAQVKERVGQYFLQRGRITGAEYQAVTSPNPLALLGIENQGLYDANQNTLLGFLNEESRGYCQDLRYALERLKRPLYNTALAKMDHERESYDQEDITLEKYCDFLLMEARRQGIALAPYKVLRLYALEHRLPINAAVDYERLLREAEVLDRAIRRKLYASAEQRQLDYNLYILKIMENLVNISATGEDLAYFRAHREAFTVVRMLRFLEDISYRFAIQPDLDPGVLKVDGFIEQAAEFYRVADKRSHAFVENILGAMQRRGESLAVLIAGGFHASHVEKALRRQDISFVTIKPRITRTDVANPYFSLLRNERTPLEKLLARNENIYAPRSLFNNTLFQRYMETVWEIELGRKLVLEDGLTGAALQQTFREARGNYAADNPNVQLEFRPEQSNPAKNIYIFEFKNSNYYVMVRPNETTPFELELGSEELYGNNFMFQFVNKEVFEEPVMRAKILSTEEPGRAGVFALSGMAARIAGVTNPVTRAIGAIAIFFRAPPELTGSAWAARLQAWTARLNAGQRAFARGWRSLRLAMAAQNPYVLTWFAGISATLVLSSLFSVALPIVPIMFASVVLFSLAFVSPDNRFGALSSFVSLPQDNLVRRAMAWGWEEYGFEQNQIVRSKRAYENVLALAKGNPALDEFIGNQASRLSLAAMAYINGAKPWTPGTPSVQVEALARDYMEAEQLAEAILVDRTKLEQLDMQHAGSYLAQLVQAIREGKSEVTLGKKERDLDPARLLMEYISPRQRQAWQALVGRHKIKVELVPFDPSPLAGFQPNGLQATRIANKIKAFAQEVETGIFKETETAMGWTRAKEILPNESADVQAFLDKESKTKEGMDVISAWRQEIEAVIDKEITSWAENGNGAVELYLDFEAKSARLFSDLPAELRTEAEAALRAELEQALDRDSGLMSLLIEKKLDLMINSQQAAITALRDLDKFLLDSFNEAIYAGQEAQILYRGGRRKEEFLRLAAAQQEAGVFSNKAPPLLERFALDLQTALTEAGPRRLYFAFFLSLALILIIPEIMLCFPIISMILAPNLVPIIIILASSLLVGIQYKQPSSWLKKSTTLISLVAMVFGVFMLFSGNPSAATLSMVTQPEEVVNSLSQFKPGALGLSAIVLLAGISGSAWKRLAGPRAEKPEILDSIEGERHLEQILAKTGDVWITSSDVDFLSLFNNVYGKQITNVILNEIMEIRAQVLHSPQVKKIIEKYDPEILHQLYAARHGGDEGMDLLPEQLSLEDITAIMNIVRKAIPQELHLKYMAYDIQGEQTPEEEKKLRAAVAAYNTKANDAQRVQVFRDSDFDLRLLVKVEGQINMGEDIIKELNLEDEKQALRAVPITLPRDITKLDYPDRKFMLTPTSTFGATKASRVSGYEQYKQNGKFKEWGLAAFKLADRLLLQGKNQGRNQVVVDDLKTEFERLSRPPPEEEFMNKGLMEQITRARENNLKNLVMQDPDGKKLYDPLVPYHLSIDGLKQKIKKRLKILHKKGQFPPEIHVARASSDRGPDKILIFILAKEGSAGLKLEGSTGVELEGNYAFEDLINQGFAAVNTRYDHAGGNFVIAEPHYFIYEMTKNEQHNWLQADLQSSFENFVKKLEEKMNVPGNKVKINLTGAYCNVSTNKLFADLKEEDQINATIGEMFRSLEETMLAKSASEGGLGKITAHDHENHKPLALARRAKLGEEKTTNLFENPEAQKRMVKETEKARTIVAATKRAESRGPGFLSVVSLLGLSSPLLAGFDISPIITAGLALAGIISGLAWLEIGFKTFSTIFRRLQTAFTPTALHKHLTQAVAWVQANPMLIVAIGVGFYALLNPEAGVETGYLAALGMGIQKETLSAGAETGDVASSRSRGLKKEDTKWDNDEKVEIKELIGFLADTHKDKLERHLSEVEKQPIQIKWIKSAHYIRSGALKHVYRVVLETNIGEVLLGIRFIRHDSLETRRDHIRAANQEVVFFKKLAQILGRPWIARKFFHFSSWNNELTDAEQERLQQIQQHNDIKAVTFGLFIDGPPLDMLPEEIKISTFRKNIAIIGEAWMEYREGKSSKASKKGFYIEDFKAANFALDKQKGTVEFIDLDWGGFVGINKFFKELFQYVGNTVKEDNNYRIFYYLDSRPRDEKERIFRRIIFGGLLDAWGTEKFFEMITKYGSTIKAIRRDALFNNIKIFIQEQADLELLRVAGTFKQFQLDPEARQAAKALAEAKAAETDRRDQGFSLEQGQVLVPLVLGLGGLGLLALGLTPMILAGTFTLLTIGSAGLGALVLIGTGLLISISGRDSLGLRARKETLVTSFRKLRGKPGKNVSGLLADLLNTTHYADAVQSLLPGDRISRKLRNATIDISDDVFNEAKDIIAKFKQNPQRNQIEQMAKLLSSSKHIRQLAELIRIMNHYALFYAIYQAADRMPESLKQQVITNGVITAPVFFAGSMSRMGEPVPESDMDMFWVSEDAAVEAIESMKAVVDAILDHELGYFSDPTNVIYSVGELKSWAEKLDYLERSKLLGARVLTGSRWVQDSIHKLQARIMSDVKYQLDLTYLARQQIKQSISAITPKKAQKLTYNLMLMANSIYGKHYGSMDEVMEHYVGEELISRVDAESMLAAYQYMIDARMRETAQRELMDNEEFTRRSEEIKTLTSRLSSALLPLLQAKMVESIVRFGQSTNIKSLSESLRNRVESIESIQALWKLVNIDMNADATALTDRQVEQYVKVMADISIEDLDVLIRFISKQQASEADLLTATPDTSIDRVISEMQREDELDIQVQPEMPEVKGFGRIRLNFRASGLGRALNRFWGMPAGLKLMMLLPDPGLKGFMKIVVISALAAGWMGIGLALGGTFNVEMALAGVMLGLASFAPVQYTYYKLNTSLASVAGQKLIDSGWMKKIFNSEENLTKAELDARLIKGLLAILDGVKNNEKARIGVLEVLSRIPTEKTVVVYLPKDDKLLLKKSETWKLPSQVIQSGNSWRLRKVFPGIKMIKNGAREDIPLPTILRALGSSA